MSDVYGYFFNTDWGPENDRVSSLIYTQLYDMWDPFDVSMNGSVAVLADGAEKPCEFEYDYRN